MTFGGQEVWRTDAILQANLLRKRVDDVRGSLRCWVRLANGKTWTVVNESASGSVPVPAAPVTLSTNLRSKSWWVYFVQIRSSLKADYLVSPFLRDVTVRSEPDDLAFQGGFGMEESTTLWLRHSVTTGGRGAPVVRVMRVHDFATTTHVLAQVGAKGTGCVLSRSVDARLEPTSVARILALLGLPADTAVRRSMSESKVHEATIKQ